MIRALFHFEDQGVGLGDDHAVPGARFDINERRFLIESMAISQGAVAVENEDVQPTLNEADRFTGVREEMAMGTDVSAGLEEIEEALDPGFLRSLDGENHAEAGALAGSLQALGAEGVGEGEDVASGVWEGICHGIDGKVWSGNENDELFGVN